MSSGLAFNFYACLADLKDTCHEARNLELLMSEHAHVDLLDVISFIRVVATGSISKAAARLGVAKSIGSLIRSTVHRLAKRQPSGCALSNTVFSNVHLDQGLMNPA